MFSCSLVATADNLTTYKISHCVRCIMLVDRVNEKRKIYTVQDKKKLKVLTSACMDQKFIK